ncbi:hypothetical protein [Carboxylicivirga sp. M1479]|uniref:hypothetical protein n=2 Tax=Carboxylicivirga TaxID=1628153 RepID=UPI001C8F453D|nr:hypothetical protein [Carboxylicivirga sp. M1479]
MKMIDFSSFEENVTKVDAIRGGGYQGEVQYTGEGLDATSGQSVVEAIVVEDDGSWRTIYYGY